MKSKKKKNVYHNYGAVWTVCLKDGEKMKQVWSYGRG